LSARSIHPNKNDLVSDVVVAELRNFNKNMQRAKRDIGSNISIDGFVTENNTIFSSTFTPSVSTTRFYNKQKFFPEFQSRTLSNFHGFASCDQK